MGYPGPRRSGEGGLLKVVQMPRCVTADAWLNRTSTRVTLGTFIRMVWTVFAEFSGAAKLKIVDPPVDVNTSMIVGFPGLRIPISKTSVRGVSHWNLRIPGPASVIAMFAV